MTKSHYEFILRARGAEEKKWLKSLKPPASWAVVRHVGLAVKSVSLVREGSAPALFGGMIVSGAVVLIGRVALMRPSNDPIGNLARALSAPEVFGSECRRERRDANPHCRGNVAARQSGTGRGRAAGVAEPLTRICWLLLISSRNCSASRARPGEHPLRKRRGGFRQTAARTVTPTPVGAGGTAPELTDHRRRA